VTFTDFECGAIVRSDCEAREAAGWFLLGSPGDAILMAVQTAQPLNAKLDEPRD
jgi:hypothetical protein